MVWALKLFGGAGLQQDGRPVEGPVAQRQRLGVLAVLALSPDGVTRDRLVGLLWPDSSPEKARHALSNALYAIRRALPDGTVSGAGERLYLDETRLQVDVRRFGALLADGDLESAVDLYSGPFLEGFSVHTPEFEHWTDEIRERLDSQAREALGTLAAEAGDRDDWAQAAEHLRRLLGIDPLSATHTTALMRALFNAGEGAAALRQARVHDQLRESELELGPASEVSALAAEIRARIEDGTAPRPVASTGPPADRSEGPVALDPDRREPRAVPGATSTPSGGPAEPEAKAPTRRPFIPDGSPRVTWLRVAAVGLIALGGAILLRGLADSAGGEGAGIRSIAVLPLENFSGDPQQEYFARAMTEVLTAELARIQSLSVVSRTSAEAVRGSGGTATDLAASLNVDAVVEGSVFRSGDDIRITAQLVAVRPERHLWAESYEGSFADAMRFQRDVARRVAATIAAQFADVPAPTTSAEAQDAYFLGVSRQLDFTSTRMREAVDAFRASVEADPDFGEGWAKLAESYWLLTQPLRGMDSREGMRLAREAAERALDIDPTSGLATTVLGWVSLFADWDAAAAESLFRRALSDWPFVAPAHAGLAFALSVQGRHDEAVASARRSRDLEPLVLSFRTALAEVLWYAGDLAEGHGELERVLEMDGSFGRALILDRWIAESEGDWERAVRRFVELHRLETGEELLMGPEPATREEYWRWRLARLRSPDTPDDPYGTAIARAALGDLEASLDALEDVREMRDGSVIFVPVHPAWDPYRDDARLGEFVASLDEYGRDWDR